MYENMQYHAQAFIVFYMKIFKIIETKFDLLPAMVNPNWELLARLSSTIEYPF